MKLLNSLIVLVFSAQTILAIHGGKHSKAQDNSEIRTTLVAGSIYMLEGAGGNIGVSIGEDGILMIDDKFEHTADAVNAAIEELSASKVKFLVNTHHHGDHTGGNNIFGDGAVVVAHQNVRVRLVNDEKITEVGLPVITFENGLSFHFNGEEIKVYHPGKGHTDGDAIVYFTKSNVVHVGDQMFSGRFPYIDLNSGGDVEGFIKNVEHLLNTLPDDVKIIPGHGPLSTKANLKEIHEMLLETTSLVKKKISAGTSLENIKSAGVQEKWKHYGSGFINEARWIEILYQYYSE